MPRVSGNKKMRTKKYPFIPFEINNYPKGDLLLIQDKSIIDGEERKSEIIFDIDSILNSKNDPTAEFKLEASKEDLEKMLRMITRSIVEFQCSENNIESEVKTENLTFGEAVKAAKKGLKVARKGWNGVGMFAYIVPQAKYPAQTGIAKQYFGENALVPYRAYWALKTAQDDVAAWAPSGSDSLAEDWVIVK